MDYSARAGAGAGPKWNGSTTLPSVKEEETDRRAGKGRRCCLGDVLECRTSYLAARMIWRKAFGRTSILGGGGLVWYEMDDYQFFRSIYSAKGPMFYSSISSNHPGAKSLLRQGGESILSPKQQRRPLPFCFCINSSMPPMLTCCAVFRSQYIAEPADIWSCGMVLVAMLTGELPWDQPTSDQVTIGHPVILRKDGDH